MGPEGLYMLVGSSQDRFTGNPLSRVVPLPNGLNGLLIGGY